MVVVICQTNKEIDFFFEGRGSFIQGYMDANLYFTTEAYPKPQDVKLKSED